MAYIEYLDHSTKTVPPEKAQQLRDAWVTRDTTELTQEQLDFLNKISKIHHTPEQIYCFCRFKLHKTLAMKYSNLYVLKCPQCGKQRTTDIQP